MSTYTQLAKEERYQIYALMKAGHTPTEITEVLGRHKSTISRELKRNLGLRRYRPKQAQELAHRRCQASHGTRISAADWNRVEELARQDWSPEQVSEWLCLEEGITISDEWIYLYICAVERPGMGSQRLSYTTQLHRDGPGFSSYARVSNKIQWVRISFTYRLHGRESWLIRNCFVMRHHCLLI